MVQGRKEYPGPPVQLPGQGGGPPLQNRAAAGPRQVVTTPRTCVQYVVTEFGVADLKYKSTVERARALIAIAHPDFRRELERQVPL